MVRWIIAVCIFPAIAVAQDSTRQQGPQTKSPYVARMMSLDRDRDGVLSKQELPESLTYLFKHDENNDQKLDASELAKVELAAMAARDDRDSSVQSSRRRRGGKQGNSAVGAGSPLDSEQILRFALTFDANKDGGLDASELRRYANALAIRRAQGRRRDSESNSNEQPSAPLKRDKDVKGLGAPNSKDDTAKPFGPR